MNRVYYRPQTKFAKVMFLHLSVSHSVHRGACVVAGVCAWLWGGGVCGCRGHAWLWGACMVVGGVCAVAGGMCGCRGVMHGCGGHVWLWGGHAWWGGAWLWGGMCGGGHAWWQGGGMRRIRQDAVNERAVRLLL